MGGVASAVDEFGVDLEGDFIADRRDQIVDAKVAAVNAGAGFKSECVAAGKKIIGTAIEDDVDVDRLCDAVQGQVAGGCSGIVTSDLNRSCLEDRVRKGCAIEPVRAGKLDIEVRIAGVDAGGLDDYRK